MPGSRWTPDEVDLLKELYPRPDLTIDDVASHFETRSRMACHLKAHSLGLWKNWSPEEEESLRRWYQNPAVSTREICQRLKRNKKAIYDKARHMGISRPPEQNRSHPWSEEQIDLLINNWHLSSDTIRELIPEKSDRAIRAMGKKLGLPKRLFGDAFTQRSRRSWRDRDEHITDDATCAVPNCTGWNKVLDVHHEQDGSIWVLCAGHHAMITRGYAKIVDGVYTLL